MPNTENLTCKQHWRAATLKPASKLLLLRDGGIRYATGSGDEQLIFIRSCAAAVVSQTISQMPRRRHFHECLATLYRIWRQLPFGVCFIYCHCAASSAWPNAPLPPPGKYIRWVSVLVEVWLLAVPVSGVIMTHLPPALTLMAWIALGVDRRDRHRGLPFCDGVLFLQLTSVSVVIWRRISTVKQRH